MSDAEFINPREPDKLVYPISVVAQDQTQLDEHGNPLRAEVYVPSSRFADGPRSHRFQVVDYDSSTGRLNEPATVKFPASADDAADDRKSWGFVDTFAKRTLTRKQLASDTKTARRFRSQNVYAIAARTLAKFESALGRRVPWGFGTHILYLVPHAFAEANAYYSREDNALFFGYVGQGEDRQYTSLSHDIVAHETTHAILDGLRPNFLSPGLPDQLGFHEALADIVALLSVFAIDELVETLLGEADDEGLIDSARLTREALAQDNALFGLAEGLGDFLGQERGDGLRRSVELRPGGGWRDQREYREPHRRGEVLVAAVMRTLLDMWVKRLETLIQNHPRVDRSRAAEEGASAAGHLLTMAIRAIDYCPPVEFEFEDYLAAIVKADIEVAPMDDHGYRKSVVDMFAEYDIVAKGREIVDLSERAPLYSGLNFSAMQSQRDEVYRFIWGNSSFLGIDPDLYIEVEEVRASTRVGPDGLIVRESIATYVQMVAAPISQIIALWPGDDPFGLADLDDDDALRRVATMGDVPLKILGGGTLIFDQFGRLKFHHAKPILDLDRQKRRLRYLLQSGLQDSRARFGFSLGSSRGQQFAGLHGNKSRAGEDW